MLAKFWPLLAIIGLVLVFFYPVWLRGHIPLPADFVVGVYHPWLDYKWGFAVGVPVKNPMTTDVVSFTYPMQTFALEQMKKGIWPLWNPLILAGTPLLANFQSAPFSPTAFVYFLFDQLTAWSGQIILQHLLVAFFTFLLLRHWKISKLGSVVGGIAFAFAGFNLIWSQWNGHALAASFIPLVLLFVDRWLAKGELRDGLGVTATLTLQILSGYPQVVLYTVVAVGLLWLVRVWGSKTWLKRTVFLGVFAAFSLGVSAIQILPGAELLSLSQRGVEAHPFEWAFLPWSKVITFFAPDYYGNHATQNYWGPQDYTSNTGFVGVVSFILASLALTRLRKSKEKIFLLLLLASSLILSFPTPVSILLWKSGVLGLQAASAHRALILFNLSVALLAGFGVDRLLQKRGKLKAFYSLAIPYLVIGGFGIVTLYLYWTTRGDFAASTVRNIPKYVVGLRNLVLPTATLFAATAILVTIAKFKALRKAGVFVLLVLLVFELFRFGWKFTPFVPRHIVFPKTPVLEYLTSQQKPFRVTGSRVIPINMKMPYGLEALEGYDAVYPLRIAKFLAALNGGKSGTEPLGRYGTVDNDTSHLLDLVNTKYYLTLRRDEKGNPSPEGTIHSRFETDRFKVAFEDKTTVVLESTSVLPRAFMAYDWETVEAEREIIDKLLDPDFPIGKKVLLEEVVSLEKPTGEVRQTVEYADYSAQESLINVETEADGLLFVSDAFYPGWQAFVDGRQAEIYRANFAFRAVPVPAGEHEVKFLYQPESFLNGLKLSLVSLFALFAFLPIFRILGKR